jgi:hypothetical protein
MKRLLFSCLLLATAATTATAVAPPVRPTATPPATTKIAVLFSHKTSFPQLAAIRQDLQKDGIELEYQQLAFDKNGGLLKISFHVDCRDGFAGSATSEVLTDESNFGFLRDYTSKGASAFQVGNL